MLCTNWGPKFSILARNPDMNPIENVFSYVRRKLHEEFHNRNITFENFEDFSAHVEKNFILSESMDNRLHMMVKKHGKQMKY